MNLKYRLEKMFNTNLSSIEGLLLLLSFILVIPYFILCYFNNPSIDDFSFANKTIELGYWHAQASAYTVWNGRYFASFILCAHPLVIDSYALYKMESMTLLCLTIHSFYYFISNCFSLKNKTVCFILAIVIVFWYLNNMPTLVQGIYWASGALTYHLADTLLLYLVTIIYMIVFKPESSNTKLKIICALLIIACCGSNETIMLVTVLLILCVLAYYMVIKRMISKLFLSYFILSVICFLILLSSPGGAIREKDFVDPNTKNVLFTISSCFSTGNKFLFYWIFSKESLIISILLISSYFTWGSRFPKTKESIIYALLLAIGGYFLVIATFSPGFWATARIAPDRAINCSYWIFVTVWSVLLFFITAFFYSAITRFKTVNFSSVILLCVLGLLITIKSSGNYYNACDDLISGKAYVYKKECQKRVAIMKEANDSTICEVPAFSIYPKSVFNDDMVADDFNWWNREYAKYYHRKAVRVIRKEPCSSHKYLTTFDDANTKTFSNAATITNEISFSSPNSSVVVGPDGYSAAFTKVVRDMDIDNPSAISTLNVSAVVYSKDSLINSVLVFSVTDPKGKSVFWYGKEIVKKDYPVNKWVKENFSIPITQSSILDEQNRVSVYLWNRGKGKVYSDDLFVELF